MLTRPVTICMFLVGISVFCGCPSSHNKQSAEISETHPPMTNILESESELEERLSAANNISNLQTRQEALEGLAIWTAKVGNVKFAKKVLTHMSDQTRRHTTASNCAYYLALAGESRGARSIAGTIPDVDLRNQTFKRIAALE